MLLDDFASVTRDSFYGMCQVFVCKNSFRYFNSLQRFSSGRITQPTNVCLGEKHNGVKSTIWPRMKTNSRSYTVLCKSNASEKREFRSLFERKFAAFRAMIRWNKGAIFRRIFGTSEISR